MQYSASVRCVSYRLPKSGRVSLRARPGPNDKLRAMDEPVRIIPLGRIESLIYFLRGEKVMLDFDLAEIYGVETKPLNRAVKRNLDRFPEDFMFQLTEEETASLRLNIGSSKTGAGGGISPTPSRSKA